jgi:hypothetical protein
MGGCAYALTEFAESLPDFNLPEGTPDEVATVAAMAYGIGLPLGVGCLTFRAITRAPLLPGIVLIGTFGTIGIAGVAMKMAADAVQISDEQIGIVQARLRTCVTNAQDKEVVDLLSSEVIVMSSKANWMMLTVATDSPEMPRHAKTGEPVLTRTGLSHILSQTQDSSPGLTQLRVEHMFSLMDANSDGFITFQEFFAGMGSKCSS